jgi:hypothetical protein
MCCSFFVVNLYDYIPGSGENLPGQGFGDEIPHVPNINPYPPQLHPA